MLPASAAAMCCRRNGDPSGQFDQSTAIIDDGRTDGRVGGAVQGAGECYIKIAKSARPPSLPPSSKEEFAPPRPVSARRAARRGVRCVFKRR